ncbi:MAG: NADH-quinone oxidoreductase subunit L, partial [Planctomycetota bacterium]
CMVQYFSRGLEPVAVAWPWLPFTADGRALEIGPYVDAVSVLLVSMVTLISTLVHVYSIGYMEHDPRRTRFMAYMQLFTFAMLTIVVANSLLQLFIGWELVGLTSYLLIGFWHEKRGPQLACKKAWVMNRIGDAGFIIGFGILFWQFGGDVVLRATDPATGMFGSFGLNRPDSAGGVLDPMAAGVDEWWLTIAGIGLFFGAIGKSAQFPLQTWLPDAMEGPTPVSAYLHSATMVAAGVYLTARIMPLLTPAAHLFIATIGLITLVIAALIACVQTDIKRVLAYSTLSQLGYMILALGVGGYAFALFHLITHAFFKCCLFQCSGSVINACHHEQDMRYYGGLAKKMPLTTLAFALSTLAIAGTALPYLKIGGEYLGFAGFYSKDGIIAATINYGESLAGAGAAWGSVFFWGPVIVAYITPFYMGRAFVLTFLGKPRDKHIHEHARETSWTMTVPQLVLAAFAVAVGWPILGLGEALQTTAPMTAQGFDHHSEMAHAFHRVHALLPLGLNWILPLLIAWLVYRNGFAIANRIVALPVVKQIHWWLQAKMGFDGLYDGFVVLKTKAIALVAAGHDRFVVDGIVNGTARLTRVAGDTAGQFDFHVIDGVVRGSGNSALRVGSALHRAHAGNIRVYILVLALALLFVLASAISVVWGVGRLTTSDTPPTATSSATNEETATLPHMGMPSSQLPDDMMFETSLIPDHRACSARTLFNLPAPFNVHDAERSA